MRICFCLLLFFFYNPIKLLAQNKIEPVILLSNNCKWDEADYKVKKELKNKAGFVYVCGGTLIINIKGRLYNPCNIPFGLIGKRVLISGIIYKGHKNNGIPIKLTSLKIDPN